MMCLPLPVKPRRSLLDVPTSERTEEELDREWYKYVESKTVQGRFCPTPELGTTHDDPGEEVGVGMPICDSTPKDVAQG